LDHIIIIVHDHDHVPFFSHAGATFVDNYFQQPHP
jgi:hypothetical protein